MANILYFARLVDKLGTPSEEVELPAAITDARVTVNRQFAAPDTNIDNTKEIAIVPARPG